MYYFETRVSSNVRKTRIIHFYRLSRDKPEDEGNEDDHAHDNRDNYCGKLFSGGSYFCSSLSLLFSGLLLFLSFELPYHHFKTKGLAFTARAKKGYGRGY